ncbi:MAG: hypothetical protein ACRCR2_02490 [Fusobacteriaceae bacterium]
MTKLTPNVENLSEQLIRLMTLADIPESVRFCSSQAIRYSLPEENKLLGMSAISIENEFGSIEDQKLSLTMKEDPSVVKEVQLMLALLHVHSFKLNLWDTHRQYFFDIRHGLEILEYLRHKL